MKKISAFFSVIFVVMLIFCYVKSSDVIKIGTSGEIASKNTKIAYKQTKSIIEKSTNKDTYDLCIHKYWIEENGVLLELFVPTTVRKENLFKCEAKITNKTDRSIFFEYNIWKDESINHSKILVKINAGSYCFTDYDTIFPVYLNANATEEIKPGESYIQNMTFIPARVVSYKEYFQLSGVQFEYFETGVYDGSAAFHYKLSRDGAGNDSKILLKFSIEVV